MSGAGAWPRHDRVYRAAFLDVDGTLLPGTTAFLFAGFLHERGILRRSVVLWSLWQGVLHRAGRLDYERLARESVGGLARYSYVGLERLSYECFVERVRPALFAGVVDHLNSLREAGTELVLVSSSPGFVIAPLAQYLSCSGYLTTRLVVKRDRIVGLGEGPVCYGPGKLLLAQRWSAEREIRMDDTIAYADNYSDRFLLREAGQAVVVNARGRLRGLARSRGWVDARPTRAISG